MEDIEKEIAEEEGHENIEMLHENSEKENKRKEDDNIRFSKMGSNQDKKRNIIIIVFIVIAVILIGVIGIITLTKEGDKSNNKDDDNTEEVVKEDINKKVSYVACDDASGHLNVRNSIAGDIIDGLSCFEEVELLEEAGSSDICDKWYRVNYQRKGNTYTGYVCGKYVKESITDATSIKKMREVIDKVNKYYDDNQVMVYCGGTTDSKTIQIKEDGHTFDAQYLKSEFKSIEELKKYILTFMDESLIKVKLEVSDYNNPKMFDNYYEIDGNLYCRNYSAKGWHNLYTGNYNIEVVSETENIINLRIAYEYLDENKVDENGGCSLTNISSCPTSYFKYVIKNATLSRNNGNYIVTKMEFHD